MKSIFKLLSWFMMATVTFSCTNPSGNEAQTTNIESTESTTERGKKVYQKYCIVCHGYDGSMGSNGAFNLQTSDLTFEEKQIVVKKGRNTMTAFEKVLSENEIHDVVQYIHQWSQNQE